MTRHFNGLSPAEAERLAMLIEECGEIITAATKVLRHGYESRHPLADDRTNRDDLDREIEDVLAVVQEMRINGDIDPRRPSTEDLFDRWESKERWTHHQGAEVAE